jgi:DeoR/GlpR family transcriptional regulator of sugar metabolism
VLDIEESHVKRAMIANAAEVVAVSAADKLGSAGPYVIAPLEELTYVVTERDASAEQLDGFRAAGVEVVLV